MEADGTEMKIYSLLQSLLEKRVRQTSSLLKLCQSVAACEENVRELYSLLGWEYSDSDSEEESTGGGLAQPPSKDPAPQGPNSKHDQERNNVQNSFPILKRNAKVVLTRLSPSQIKSVKRPRLDQSSSESDDQWVPENSSSDSDFLSDFNTESKKGRRSKKRGRSHSASKRKKNTVAEVNGGKTYAPPLSASSTMKSSAPQRSPDSDPKSSKSASNTTEKTTAQTTKAIPLVTPGSHHADTAKTVQRLTPGEISINMSVLAKYGKLDWKRGTIKEIITKDDGRLKYKVVFEERGKCLVSGHHIAFTCMPKVGQLFVGARVVIQKPPGNPVFTPGVIAELPSRSNRMRFLVMVDDHTPVYVNLLSLHLVCKPLEDPLDDIPNETYRIFMREYLSRWPFPSQLCCAVGETLKAEHNGEQQKCEVLSVDSSLIHVSFLSDQHKEWLYRGSIRLESMANLRQKIESQLMDKDKIP
ncbi:uncharacterized protein ACNS7B_013488 [Menidia menidia]